MSLALQFALSLAATVVALGAVVWTGITHRRSAHYGCIAIFVVCLTVAIWRAETYGRGLVFEGAAAVVHTVHMGAVAATFLILPFVAWTGVRLARGTRPGTGGASPRRGHRRASEIFVGLVLLTSALGTAMTLLASRA